MSSSIPQTSGIYQIRCIPTGKVYVGSAVDLAARWRTHQYDLRHGKHSSQYLQRAWNKHGEDAFRLEIIELVLSPFLLEREQYWLDKLQAYDPRKGFNTARHAGSRMGVKWSAESIQKRLNTMKGRPRPPMSEEQKRKISEIRRGKDLAGNTGRKHSAEVREHMSAAKRGRPEHPNTARAKVEATSKYYVITAPDGYEATIKNLSAFCREKGLSRECMYATMVGKIRSHRGWKCRLAEDGE